MSNSFDPDQARQFVHLEPDQGPICLPRPSADDKGRKRVRYDDLKAYICPYYVFIRHLITFQYEI